MQLHLLLTEHWFTETEDGHKLIEYRTMSPHWKSRIWERRHTIQKVRFQRGFKKNPKTMVFNVVKIDIGKCPIEGWDDKYYRIHFR
jgi:hypothetical protein